jgi:hypothetical protein
MERQAGLGRSLGEVLESLTPVGPPDSEPRHVLFGIGPDEPSTTKSKKKSKSKKKKKSKSKKKSR